MNTINRFFKYSLLLGAVVLYTGCGSDDDPAPDNSIDMTLTGTGLQSQGDGAYSLAVESGTEVTVAVNMESASTLENLVITKTRNNAVDPSFGTNGTTTVNATGNEFAHTFTYTPTVEDVDQLVGFTFTGTTDNGGSEEVVLTMVVTLSPIDNLPRRRWELTSVYHVNEDEEAIRECQKDNSWLLNEDGSFEEDFGEDTATGDCAFDGFNVYNEWSITEEDDVMYFTREGYGLFTPDTPIEDTFTIVNLTTTTMELQQTVDLSDFGGGTEETFIYKFRAVPR
ncbi:lipocalin family protein [Cesiribacter sp. SM1]|uniref:lipocalin family protein n=1 Tax=Cesiribacter sp. SM1 TaxID=2861196 RepID=UPI001CD51BD7|nr:lipocalin family protein [Cesiribacter sp. SM1]